MIPLLPAINKRMLGQYVLMVMIVVVDVADDVVVNTVAIRDRCRGGGREYYCTSDDFKIAFIPQLYITKVLVVWAPLVRRSVQSILIKVLSATRYSY
jgi:hypothetical protein